MRHVRPQLVWANTPELIEQVFKLAEKFGKKVNPKRATIAILKGEKVVAYIQLIQTPLMLSVWDESEIRGRGFLEAMEMAKNWSRLQHGECIVAVHNDSKIAPMMGRLGFGNNKQTVHYA